MGLSGNFEDLPAVEVLSWAISTYGDKFAIATSFQKEGMVIADLAFRIAGRSNFRVFTLDTGRLPDATYRMLDVVRERYGIAVETVLPDPDEVAAMVSAHGRDLFYQSSELREQCCEVRKVRPFQRKVAQLDAWAGGLRREHSPTRADIPKVAEVNGRIRVCPIVDWGSDQVEQYILEHDVPIHPLYALGYASIGCDPCTRAIAPGEDQRAGRWWWEDRSAKECGIHFAADGTVKRHA